MLTRVAILPRLDSVMIDFGVLVFAGCLTLLLSLIFSFVPLLRASQKHKCDALKNESRVLSATKSKRRLGQLFIVSEFVFSLVLLILGVLLTNSFIKLRHIPAIRIQHIEPPYKPFQTHRVTVLSFE